MTANPAVFMSRSRKSDLTKEVCPGKPGAGRDSKQASREWFKFRVAALSASFSPSRYLGGGGDRPNGLMGAATISFRHLGGGGDRP